MSTSSTRSPRDEHHDVVVVGARAAGASTAMLLARSGVDVLVVDRSSYGSDTLSSHILMRGGVEQLRRWGLLDRVADVTPPIRRNVFEFGDDRWSLDVADPLSEGPLYAPRRTVIDPILVDAARDAGVEFRFGTRVVEVRRDATGRVVGLDVSTGDGGQRRIGADLVIGADGLRSFVARSVGAGVTRRGRNCLASIFAYVRGAELPTDEYRFAYRAGSIGGAVPTNDDLHCIYVSMSPDEFRRSAQLDVRTALERRLAAVSPSLAAGARAGSLVETIRSFPGHHGQFRQAYGPGWALVGDAGYFKDPAAAHGLSDAFRDADLLAAGVLDGDMDRYQRVRDDLSMPLFGHIERLTALDWDDAEAQRILLDVGLAMAAEDQAFLERRRSADRPVG